MTNLNSAKLQELKTKSLELGYNNIVPMLNLAELIEYKEVVKKSIEQTNIEEVKNMRIDLLKEVEEKIKELSNKKETIQIERTGVEMLKPEQYINNLDGYTEHIQVVSSFETSTDKEKNVIVELYNDGSFEYTYVDNGKRTLKTYWMNTKDFPYVVEENRSYKKSLPKWITKEQLQQLYI